MAKDLPPSVGRYALRRELGRGMMGVVYEAHDPVLGRDIALKVIQPATPIPEADRAAFEQRFLTEARTAARLSHRGIVVVHDVGRDDAGTLYIALELLQGRTLDSLLHELGRMPWRNALQVGQVLAEALHHAHAQGVVHRDIKPANVMLLPPSDPKLMDFGIAKVETSTLTAAGQFLGTPLYMSPEQALAHPVDGRSDLFSLGSMLYEMLTGQPAFAGENVTKILYQVMSRDPEPASRLVPDLPAGIDQVLGRCLAKDPALRYPDGRALAEDLEDLLAGEAPRGLADMPALPQAASQTLVAGAPPMVMPAPPPAPATPPAEAPIPQAPASPTGARGRPLLRFAMMAAVVGAVSAALVISRRDRAESGSPRATLSVAPPAPSERPSAPAADEGSSASPDAARESNHRQPEPAPARLAVDFDYPVKSGSLRIWVDDEPIVKDDFGARPPKAPAGVKFRRSRLPESLEIAPGRRQIKVQLAWEDNVRTEYAAYTFRAGGSAKLKVRLSGLPGLRKNLSLEWP